jgi:hypothetical protein
MPLSDVASHVARALQHLRQRGFTGGKAGDPSSIRRA